MQQVPLKEVLNNLGAAQSRLRPACSASKISKRRWKEILLIPYITSTSATSFSSKGKLDEAAERFRAVLDRDPDDTEATTMLGRCLKKPIGKTPARSEGFERLKENYQESAYWQLKAVLEPRR